MFPLSDYFLIKLLRSVNRVQNTLPIFFCQNNRLYHWPPIFFSFCAKKFINRIVDSLYRTLLWGKGRKAFASKRIKCILQLHLVFRNIQRTFLLNAFYFFVDIYYFTACDYFCIDDTVF